ncbi:hypothetical protein VNO80_13559 [Phaseolus coccineus]|uniref:Uncharacterized protein n=1 Tax=Phaseolus coccineus TaxID=3886 RepID=A0AAN9N1X4_PHACN
MDVIRASQSCHARKSRTGCSDYILRKWERLSSWNCKIEKIQRAKGVAKVGIPSLGLYIAMCHTHFVCELLSERTSSGGSLAKEEWVLERVNIDNGSLGATSLSSNE